MALMILRRVTAEPSSSSVAALKPKGSSKASKGAAATATAAPPVSLVPESGEFIDVLAKVDVRTGAVLWVRPLNRLEPELRGTHALRVQAAGGRLVAVAWSSGRFEWWSPLYGVPAATATTAATPALGCSFSLGQPWAVHDPTAPAGLVDVALVLHAGRAGEPPLLRVLAAALAPRNSSSSSSSSEIQLVQATISGPGDVLSLLKEGSSLAGSLGALAGSSSIFGSGSGRLGEAKADEDADGIESVLAGMSGKHKRKLVEMDSRVARDMEQSRRAAESDSAVEPPREGRAAAGATGAGAQDRYELDYNAEAVQVRERGIAGVNKMDVSMDECYIYV